jgi:nucleotide-binding universal stress UspA family protein
MGLTVVVNLVRPDLERDGETFDLEPDGEALIKAAERHGVDLIVMGGYGHSRFQELILAASPASSSNAVEWRHCCRIK